MYKWVFDSILLGMSFHIPHFLLAIHNDDNGRSILYNARTDYDEICKVDGIDIDYLTRGPIETCKLCMSNVKDKSFWVLDNDILYDKNIPWFVDLKNNEACIVIQELSFDEQIMYQKDGYSPYSHVVLDETGSFVVDIVEKVYKSNFIVLGAYGFGSKELYDNLYNDFLKDPLSEKEWFMSALYKKAIDNNITIKAIKSENSVAIGTPEQVEYAIEHGFITIPKLRWVFDLDQTLVSLPRVPHDYTTVEPYQDKINFVKYLYNAGHYIIIHTARNMKTCAGNIDMVCKRIGDVTRKSLSDFGIPYHDLVFGKPYGDIYIDDKSSNPLHWTPEWIVGSIGFGWKDLLCNKQVHRKVYKINDEICCKIAEPEEAAGNLNFIKQCSENIINHIPKLYDIKDYEDGLRKKIIMEWKPDTIIVGHLLSYNTLTDDVFVKILELMQDMHKTPIPNDIDTMEYINHAMQNYVPKFINRIEKHDIYKQLPPINMGVVTGFFDSYKPVMRGCIHGDFWMSNLLWSHKDQTVYMIDMRGRLGKLLTPVGDVFYDYAKLYQSIVGFDSLIFRQKRVDKYLKTHLENIMFQQLELNENEVDSLKKITAILVLGSLPFHKELKDVVDIVKEIVEELWPSIFVIN